MEVISPLHIFLWIALLAVLIAAIGIWMFPVREMQCSPRINDHKHEWKFTGDSRQIKLSARMTSPTYHLIKCSKCGARGWAMQRYLPPIWLVHEIPEGW